MEKIILADGTEREVPTVDELAALNKAAEEKTALETKLAGFENDPVQKNWNAMRQINDNLKASLKAQGKEVKDDGTVVDAPPPAVNADEVIKKATDAATVAAQQVALDQYKRNLLSRYNEEERKVVDHYYSKLSSGETVTVENMEKFVSEAARLAVPNSAPPKFVPGNGQAPRFAPTDGPKFSETEAGKSIANEVFGPNSFAAPTK